MRNLLLQTPLASLLAVLFAACAAESDGLAPAAQPDITFRAKAVEGVSRAAINDISSLTAFRVWGWANDATGGSIQVFRDQRVERQAAGWIYAPQAFWIPARTYHFLALATSQSTGESGLTGTASTTFSAWPTAATASFTLNDSYDEDLLYATAERVTPESVDRVEAVPFTFRHALAQLVIHVKQTTISGCHVRLRSLSFTPASAGATFVPTVITTQTEVPPATQDGTPTILTTDDVQLTVSSTTPGTRTRTFLTDNAAGHTMPHTTAPMLLIPGAMGTITVSYELWQDSPEALLHARTDVMQATGVMEAGHSYRATVILPSPTQVVTLQSTLAPWGDDNDTDREILSI